MPSRGVGGGTSTGGRSLSRRPHFQMLEETGATEGEVTEDEADEEEDIEGLDVFKYALIAFLRSFNEYI